MRVDGKHYRSIWLNESDNTAIMVIDQRKLPFFFEIKELRSVQDVYAAIADMTVRGAPSIGAAAAFGIYLATLEITSQTNIWQRLGSASRYLVSCRPTAVNLSWAVNHMMEKLENVSPARLREAALASALGICETEIESCRMIGSYGLHIIEDLGRKKNGNTVNILTHCNAGWLACIDYGTALSPVFLAHDKGIKVHVWVDETRPRNQGARLTAWELEKHGVPFTIVADNTGGHLMQHGMVDIVITGSDRTTRNGDTANKVGTYLKALAAHDNNIPFYCALPSTSIDFATETGNDIPVEQRQPDEISYVEGLLDNEIRSVRISPENAPAANYGFDVTPARLITGLITEKGICSASGNGIAELFPGRYGRNSQV